MTGGPLLSRLRDLEEVEALLAWEQTRFREQVVAWRAAGTGTAPPPVPESYREAVARLQIALARLALTQETPEPSERS